MTPKGHGVIRGRRDLLYDLKGQGDLWASLWPQKVTRSLEVAVTFFMTLKGTVIFLIGLALYITPIGHGSLEVAVTYFMTPKVTVTFVIGLT